MKKLSIITINFNNHDGLEKTFNSIFNQTNKNFEYIVIDGGSTDKSKDLIIQHKEKISYWVSESDYGIYHAMNKGITQATGEYLLFINSGDLLFNENTIEEATENLNSFDFIYGNIKMDNNIWNLNNITPNLHFFTNYSLPHPSTFIKKELFNKILYNETYKIASDWEFFFVQIIINRSSFKYINQTISIFDTTGISSSPNNIDTVRAERITTYNKYLPGLAEIVIENEKLKAKIHKLPHRRLNRLIKRIKKQLKNLFKLK